MSGNLLNARPLDGKGSDALSDISESGTGTSVSGRTSWDSREELRDLVTMLGLPGVDDLYQDRFRVDRKKLEHMLQGKFYQFDIIYIGYIIICQILLCINKLLHRNYSTSEILSDNLGLFFNDTRVHCH